MSDTAIDVKGTDRWQQLPQTVSLAWNCSSVGQPICNCLEIELPAKPVPSCIASWRSGAKATRCL